MLRFTHNSPFLPIQKQLRRRKVRLRTSYNSLIKCMYNHYRRFANRIRSNENSNVIKHTALKIVKITSYIFFDVISRRISLSRYHGLYRVLISRSYRYNIFGTQRQSRIFKSPSKNKSNLQFVNFIDDTVLD